MKEISIGWFGMVHMKIKWICFITLHVKKLYHDHTKETTWKLLFHHQPCHIFHAKKTVHYIQFNSHYFTVTFNVNTA